MTICSCNSLGRSLLVLLFAGFIICPGNIMAQPLTAKDTLGKIIIREGDKEILHFQYQSKSYHGEYERAGYVHPLYGLNGEVLTEDMPEDHPYHRGIFWAWHQVLLNGKKVADGWMSENIRWKPLQINIEKRPDALRLNNEMCWRLITGKDTVDLVKEHTQITVFARQGNIRMIDFDIHLFPLLDNISLGGSEDEKGYGGFCMRLNLPADIRFRSGEKTITPKETAVMADNWMDFTGSFSGKGKPASGIFALAQSEGEPTGQQWILRSQKSMQNIVDPGNKPARIPSAGWHRKYRLVVHDGDLGIEKINQLTASFNEIK